MFLGRLFTWYGRRTVICTAILVIILIIVGTILRFQDSEPGTNEDLLPVVKVSQISRLSGDQSLTLLGTVEAVSEAEIISEAAGRVTTVPVSLGQEISAGQIIATIENSSERASVLQAEGIYEAALASAAGSQITVKQAETELRSVKSDARSTLQNAYTVVSNAYFTTIDTYYNDPTSPLTTPYLANNNRDLLRRERVAFQKILPLWQEEIINIDTNTDYNSLINESIDYTVRTRVIVDSLVAALQNRESETFNGTSIITLIAELNGLRSTIEGTITSLNSAHDRLVQANDSLAQAEIGGPNVEISAANAQIKQALGSLRAAEANLAKTIMQSPIAGTVNELNVKVGDFLNSFTPVAIIANNNALQVTVFVGEADLDKLSVGSRVLIGGNYEGIITHIGAGIDQNTQKTEIKIATETSELTNGNAVSVSFTDSNDGTEIDSQLILPISAVKFNAESGFVYTVENNVIVEHPIEIKNVRGGFVEIDTDLPRDTEIVIDARGLTVGSKVEPQR